MANEAVALRNAFSALLPEEPPPPEKGAPQDEETLQRALDALAGARGEDYVRSLVDRLLRARQLPRPPLRWADVSDDDPEDFGWSMPSRRRRETRGPSK
jgi:hypothetical protein